MAEVPPAEMYMYIRKKYVYLKTTADTIRSLKSQFNINEDLYVFISKKDEQKCKKPMEIYNNILETEKFEVQKKKLLERNERHGKKCKITFSEKANAEFAFLIENVELSESTLRAAARKKKMGLHEFMDYYSHKKKLYMEERERAKEKDVHSRHKHAAVKRRTRRENKRSKKITQSMQDREHFHAHNKSPTQKMKNKNNPHCAFDAAEEITVLHPDKNSVENIFSFTEKNFKSSKIAAASNLYSCPEVLPREKVKPTYKELRVCLTKIDMQVKKSHVTVQETSTHITKKKIEEKNRKSPQNKLSISLPNTPEESKNCNTYPLSDAPSEKEIAVLHPSGGVLSFDPPKNPPLSNSVENINFLEKICLGSSEITAIPTKNKFYEKEEHAQKKMVPQLLSERKKDNLHVMCGVTNIDIEVKKSCAEHTRSQTAHSTKRKIIESTEKTRKIPRILQSIHVHSVEKGNTYPPDAPSEEEISLLHPGLLSFDQPEKQFCEKEEEREMVPEILPERTIQDDLHVVRGVTNIDMEVKKSCAQHTRSQTAAKRKIVETKIPRSLESMHMHTTDKNKKRGGNTHPPDASEEEITLLLPGLLSFDQPGKQFCEKEEEREMILEILPERTIQNDLHVVCGETNIDIEVKKSCVQHTRSQTAAKRKIPRSLESMHMHTTEKKKKGRGNTHPPDATSEEEIALLLPGLLSFDQPEKQKNTEIATAPNVYLRENYDREDLHTHLYIYPDLSVGKIQEDPYTSAEEVARESSSMYIATKGGIDGGETERTTEIPQSVQQNIYSYMHGIEKNKNDTDSLHPPSNASEREITVLHPSRVLSFDACEFGKISNSVKIQSFKDKIKCSEIGGGGNEGIIPENIDEDLPSHVCAHPVTTETICVTNSKNSTHPMPNFNDEEIAVLSFDEPGEKPLNPSVEDIQYIFHTEIADENFYLREKEKIITENSMSTNFSAKYCSQDNPHTYVEESYGNNNKEIPEDPRFECVYANPAEGTSWEEISGDPHVSGVPEDTKVLECENVSDERDDLGFLLPEEYVRDTFQERDEVCGGSFSLSFPPLSHSKQNEDVSSDDSVICLDDDHTYDVRDNYPPCSVENKAPVLQRERINQFVYARKKLWVPPKYRKRIITSVFTVHPPFLNKVDKTVVFGINQSVSVSIPPVDKNSGELVAFNENEWEEKNIYETSLSLGYKAAKKKRERKIVGNTEKTRNIPQSLQSMHMHTTPEKNKKGNTHPPDAPNEQNYYSNNSKQIGSSEITAISSKNEFYEKEEQMVPEILSERKIEDNLHVVGGVTNIDLEVKKSYAHHTCSQTAAKRERKIVENTDKKRKIPQSLQSMHMHTTPEKNKKGNTHPPDAPSEEEISLLLPGLLSFDQPEKHPPATNSIENINFFTHKSENIKIATAPSEYSRENYDREREDLHLYIYPELSVGKIQEYPYAESSSMYIATKGGIDGGETENTMDNPQSVQEEGPKEISLSDTVDRLSFHMYVTEENNPFSKNITHPIPDSSDEEITVLSFDEPGEKPLNPSVEDIQYIFQSTEIADENFCMREKEKIITENNLSTSFSAKYCCSEDNPHTYIEESYGNNKEIPEHPRFECVYANPAEGSTWEEISGDPHVSGVPEDTEALECENVSDERDDLGFLLPEEYVRDTFQEGVRVEVCGGSFSRSFPPLSHSNQYEDISSDDSVICLDDDHTYDAPSCSVENKAPVLQRERINQFVYARKKLWVPPKYRKRIVTSMVTVHPPFLNKVDKTIVLGINQSVSVSIPPVDENSGELVAFNENEWEGKNIYETSLSERESEYPSKQNYQYSKSHQVEQIGQPSRNSVPKYNAASFYDIMSSEILEDKI